MAQKAEFVHRQAAREQKKSTLGAVTGTWKTCICMTEYLLKYGQRRRFGNEWMRWDCAWERDGPNEDVSVRKQICGNNAYLRLAGLEHRLQIGRQLVIRALC